MLELPDDVWCLIWRHVFSDCVKEMQNTFLCMFQSRAPMLTLVLNHGNIKHGTEQFYSRFHIGVLPIQSSEGRHEFLLGRKKVVYNQHLLQCYWHNHWACE